MKFPNPYLPKSQTRWPLKWRQRFVRYYWNPWFKVKCFFEKWVSIYGVLVFFDRVAFNYLLWSKDMEEKLERKGKM